MVSPSSAYHADDTPPPGQVAALRRLYENLAGGKPEPTFLPGRVRVSKGISTRSFATIPAVPLSPYTVSASSSSNPASGARPPSIAKPCEDSKCEKLRQALEFKEQVIIREKAQKELLRRKVHNITTRPVRLAECPNNQTSSSESRQRPVLRFPDVLLTVDIPGLGNAEETELSIEVAVLMDES